jgi:hypothetical protein
MALNRRRSTLSADDLVRISKTCEAISESAADDAGFVPVRSLLDRFRARLICRPLLVEGMFGSIESDSQPGQRDWVVLINSEKYAVSADDILRESSEDPLDVRFRFTVAHELAHSLAFRASEFGIHLRSIDPGSFSNAELVGALEGETDALATHLLCPVVALRAFFKTQGQVLKLSDLGRLRRMLGVSRPVLINRLRQLSSTHESQIRQLPALANTAIGIGVWNGSRAAALRNWPVFANFSNNLMPKLLLELVQQDFLPAIEAFNNPNFSACGGELDAVEVSMKLGTPGTLSSEQMEVVCSLESSRRTEGSTFLWMMQDKLRPSSRLN